MRTLESTTTAPQAQEEQARDNKRLEQLQGSVKALLEQSAKNEATLLALRARLEKAETERAPLEVVYALGALVLACGGGLAYLLSRGSRGSRRARD